MHRTSVKLAAITVGIVAALVLLEIGLRAAVAIQFGENVREKMYRTQYSQEELDRSRPLYLRNHAAECITHRTGQLHWNNWFGYQEKIVDKDCVKRLFASKPVKVVLMGGSAMENLEAPNHLTHLNVLAFQNDERIGLINLAESGARLANMIARFVQDVVELRPDAVVFLDGFNEYNSVRYGGEPGDDFYYTAGVKSRIHNPMRVLVDKVIDGSHVLQLGLLRTGLWESARSPQTLRAQPPAAPDAAIYLRQRDVAQGLCDRYRIRCVFILQPTVFTTSPRNANAAEALADHTKDHPRDAQLFSEGLALIRESAEWRACGNCYDATNLLAGTENAFFDAVHVTKHGGARLGRLIYEAAMLVPR